MQAVKKSVPVMVRTVLLNYSIKTEIRVVVSRSDFENFVIVMIVIIIVIIIIIIIIIII